MEEVQKEEAPGEHQNQQQLSSTSEGTGDSEPAARPEDTGRRPAEGGAAASSPALSPVDHFRMKRFFVLRPGTLNQALKDVQAMVQKDMDGSVLGIWLMAEIDHWNNEKERLAIITENTLLIIKYDFVMFNTEYMYRIPLNYVDRISYGPFTFPERSILKREGEGVRVFWDRLREPSFMSRWNPFTKDFPYITFTNHPVRNISEEFTSRCDVQTFREQLKDAAQRVHTMKPVPGKANGVLVLNQTILIEAYVGLMSVLGNQNRLGYCMARGNIGF